ncbi:sulfotransferase family 2 domain-containing protein [uncultured Roseovarius sp.]|uniref:sulfotransferase family 2 domain-containing protein n=1 Tax=uncultured Roseovarius sp. TaxID=293344 RepID=UPI00260CB67A|nr:sulfotransferase family 2 domain-containing protein [uncultured Roseovarius sp.]
MSAQFKSVLASFSKPRHFLQNIYAVADARMPHHLVYMRNHKAACTSVILSLMKHRATLEGENVDDLNIREVHGRPAGIFVDVKALGGPASHDLVQSPESFTFSFVRHPLERAASAFADKVAGSPRHRAKIMRTIGKSGADDITFPEFIHALTTNPAALDLDRHWRPQHKELASGLISYDFLGALPNMDRDLPAILTFGFGAGQNAVADARDAFGHKTRSKDLIDELSSTEKSAFEEVMAQDYALYEDALGAAFTDGP